VGLCLAARERLTGTERASGAAQPKFTENGSVERWATGEVEIVIDDSVRKVGPEAMEAVQSAFGNWLGSGASLPRMKLSSGNVVSQKSSLVKQDGKNTISYGEIDIKGHKQDLALTITFLDPNTGRILESDIVINARHDFRTTKELSKCGGEYDLESVVTHEVGHFFGLGEDVEDDSTTMFYVTHACNVQKRELKEPDKTSMMMLYATPGSADESEQPPSSSCGTSGANARGVPELGWTALLALMLVARRRRS
jgi:MYXO-CTERM domain-containing protein